MIQKLKIKNPGCSFCRYYHVPTGNSTSPHQACLHNARLIFQKNKVKGQLKNWRWCNCQYAAEKNNRQLCPDFKVKSSFCQFFFLLKLKFNKAGKELPPAFSGEKWWST